ncbi:MAG: universal stress protein [Myxococcota bacterium]
MQIRTILVPVDFSNHSDRALRYALEIAQHFGARLHLFHAYSLPAGPATAYDYMIPADLSAGLREAAIQRLDELAKTLEQKGVEVTTEVSQGVASQAICDAVEREKPDLLVMGTRGLSGLKHVLLGSVTERTLRRVRCPVLTLHADSA